MNKNTECNGKLFRINNPYLGELDMIVGQKNDASGFFNGKIIIAPQLDTKDKLHKFITTSRILIGNGDYESDRLCEAYFWHRESMFYTPQRDLNLQSLCTNRHYRRKNLALQTLQCLAQVGLENKFSKIKGFSTPAGHALYQSLGFTFFGDCETFTTSMKNPYLKTAPFNSDVKRSGWVTDIVQDHPRFFEA